MTKQSVANHLSRRLLSFELSFFEITFFRKRSLCYEMAVFKHVVRLIVCLVTILAL